jgi:hypothetical protein
MQAQAEARPAPLGPVDVVRDLVHRGLLDAGALVDNSLDIRYVSRRNEVYLVSHPTAPAYVVKVASSDDTWATLRREAVAYSILSCPPLATPLRAFLLKLVAVDSAQRLLVLASPPNSRELRQHVMSTGRCAVRLMEALGDCLARLHNIPMTALPTQMGSELRSHRPWVLTLDRPSAYQMQGMSPGCHDVVRMVQQSHALCAGLQSLRDSWTQKSMVHGDLRWENCLAVRTAGSRWRAIRLIDWEFCHVGDPRWDQGCAFAAFLSARVSFITSGLNGRGGAAIALTGLGKAASAFWAYSCRAYPALASDARDKVATIIQFAAARLLQIALEETRQLRSLSPNAVSLVQLAENAMKTPEAVAMYLLEIDGPV